MDDAAGAPAWSEADQSRHAVSILAQAQELADRLYDQAQVDASAARAEAERIRRESEEAARTAAERQAEVEAALSSVSARLDEARWDAMRYMSDVADQASLITRTAQQSADEVLARAQKQADDILARAYGEAESMRQLADAEHDEVLQQIDHVVERAAAEVGGRIVLLADQQAQWRAALEAEARHVVDRARAAGQRLQEDLLQFTAETIQRLQREAQVSVEQALSVVRDQHAVMEAASAQVRAATLAERDRMIADLQDAADGILQETTEQIGWTRWAMTELLLEAEHEAAETRSRSQALMKARVREIRLTLKDVVARSSQRARSRMDEANDAADQLQARARDVLASAEQSAQETVAVAQRQAQRLIEEATDDAEVRVDRAARRVAEAEAAADVIRGKAAAELEDLQRIVHERNQASRDEAMAMLAQARSDADAVRHEAKVILAKARDDVATLTRRRQEIAAELGHLSGVLEALAVSEHVSPAAVDISLSRNDLSSPAHPSPPEDEQP